MEAAKAAVKAATGAARDADRQLSQVHASLCARLPLFPELHRLLPDAAPRELLPIFHPQRTLKVYSNLRSLGTGAGRHAVRYAELEDGRPVVLKEYAVDAEGRRNCYKEAALLLCLRHPAVVPIEAVFCDVTDAHTTVHLQMPFYRNGTLREWWRACPPTAVEAASFVQALCAAVAYLHAHSALAPGRRRVAQEGLFTRAAVSRCTTATSSRTTSWWTTRRDPASRTSTCPSTRRAASPRRSRCAGPSATSRRSCSPEAPQANRR